MRPFWWRFYVFGLLLMGPSLPALAEYAGTRVEATAFVQCGDAFHWSGLEGRQVAATEFEAPVGLPSVTATAMAEAQRAGPLSARPELLVLPSPPSSSECRIGVHSSVYQNYAASWNAAGYAESATRTVVGFEVRVSGPMPESSWFEVHWSVTDWASDSRVSWGGFQLIAPDEIRIAGTDSSFTVEELEPGHYRIEGELDQFYAFERPANPNEVLTVVAFAGATAWFPPDVQAVEIEIRPTPGLSFEARGLDSSVSIQADTSFSSPGTSGALSTAQKSCVRKTGRAGVALARAHGRHLQSCLRRRPVTKPDRRPVFRCTLKDQHDAGPRSRLGRSLRRARKADERACRALGGPPSLGYADAGLLIDAVFEAIDIPVEVGGASDYFLERAGAKGEKCIRAMLRETSRLYTSMLADGVKAVDAVLASGPRTQLDVSAAVFPEDDPRTARDLASDRLAKRVKRSCARRDLTKLFRPDAAGSLDETANYAVSSVRCSACATLNSWYGLTKQCDLFEDGTANHRCRGEPYP